MKTNYQVGEPFQHAAIAMILLLCVGWATTATAQIISKVVFTAGKSTCIHSGLLIVCFLKQGMVQCLCFIYNDGYKPISSLKCICALLFLSISATVLITMPRNLCSTRLHLAAVTCSYTTGKSKSQAQRSKEENDTHPTATRWNMAKRHSGCLQQN